MQSLEGDGWAFIHAGGTVIERTLKIGEAIDVESEVYCRRRSGNFWRMRAALGLACAQAATLGTQVVGRPRSRPRYAARPRH